MTTTTNTSGTSERVARPVSYDRTPAGASRAAETSRPPEEAPAKTKAAPAPKPSQRFSHLGNNIDVKA